MKGQIHDEEAAHKVRVVRRGHADMRGCPFLEDGTNLGDGDWEAEVPVVVGGGRVALWEGGDFGVFGMDTLEKVSLGNRISGVDEC